MTRQERAPISTLCSLGSCYASQLTHALPAIYNIAYIQYFEYTLSYLQCTLQSCLLCGYSLLHPLGNQLALPSRPWGSPNHEQQYLLQTVHCQSWPALHHRCCQSCGCDSCDLQNDHCHTTDAVMSMFSLTRAYTSTMQ